MQTVPKRVLARVLPWPSQLSLDLRLFCSRRCTSSKSRMSRGLIGTISVKIPASFSVDYHACSCAKRLPFFFPFFFFFSFLFFFFAPPRSRSADQPNVVSLSVIAQIPTDLNCPMRARLDILFMGYRFGAKPTALRLKQRVALSGWNS